MPFGGHVEASGLATCHPLIGPHTKTYNPSKNKIARLVSLGLVLRKRIFLRIFLLLTGHPSQPCHKISLFWILIKTRYLPHTTLVFWTVVGVGIKKTRYTQPSWFQLILVTFNFEQNLWTPDHSSPLGRFWTPKDLITCLVDEGTTPSPFQPRSTFPCLV